MNILTFNVGSSSIKYSVFSGEKILFGNNIKNIFTKSKRKSALKKIISEINNKKININVVAHRIVHGKDFKEAKLITPKLIKELRKIAELAPLHELPEIEVVVNSQKVFDVPHFAVFDTAFHQTMPVEAYK